MIKLLTSTKINETTFFLYEQDGTKFMKRKDVDQYFKDIEELISIEVR